MNKLLLASLVISVSYSVFATPNTIECEFVVSLQKTTNNGYTVTSAGANPSAANQLIVNYNTRSGKLNSLSAPKFKSEDQKCDDDSEDAYCQGDFITSKSDGSSNAGSSNLASGISSSISGVLGNLGIEAKPANNQFKRKEIKTPFTPYPNIGNIKMAEQNSDILTSPISKTEIERCNKRQTEEDEYQTKKIAEQQEEKQYMLAAKEAAPLCSNLADKIDTAKLTVNQLKSADQQSKKIFKKYGIEKSNFCRFRLFHACMQLTGNVRSRSDANILNNCLTIKQSCIENDGHSVCY